MKQEQFERTIGQLVPAAGSRNMDYWAGVNNAAAEIAKLVEQEFAEAISKALDSYIIQLDAKEAQLAEMRQLLRGISCELDFALVTYSGLPPEIKAISKLAKKALSAAPEALWAGEAKLMHWGTDEEPFTRLRLWIAGHKGKDGQQVKVIVQAGKEMKDG